MQKKGHCVSLLGDMVLILSSLAAVHAPFAVAVLRGCSHRVSKARMPLREFRAHLYLSIRPDTRVQGHALPTARHQSPQGDGLRPCRQRGDVWVDHGSSDHGLQTCADLVLMSFRELGGDNFAHGS